MSIIGRAFLYVTRKRGKTILLFMILLTMATFVLTGLSIRKASEAAQLDLRQSLGGKFDIHVDWDNSPYVVTEIIQDLAKENELNIGDYITTHIYNTDEGDFTGKEIQVRIIGLFRPNVIEQFGETVTTYDIIRNLIFVDLQTTKELAGDEINYGFSAVNVTIDDPQCMEQIIADVKALPGIDWTAFTVDVDNETYENAAAPLAALNELVVTLLVVIIVVSAIILALILTLWTKTRIHEIGVFLSVGIRKSAIVGQYLAEVLVIAVLAFGLSYYASNAIAGQIGSHLLKQSVQAEEGDNNGSAAGASAFEVGADNLIQKPIPTENDIPVSVEPDSFALLYMIGFAVITLAVSVSSITVMRLKPREILSKMS